MLAHLEASVVGSKQGYKESKATAEVLQSIFQKVGKRLTQLKPIIDKAVAVLLQLASPKALNQARNKLLSFQVPVQDRPECFFCERWLHFGTKCIRI